MSTIHDLKCWPDSFAAAHDGSKTHEIRNEDGRAFLVGDVLRLSEWCPSLDQRATVGPGGVPYTKEQRESEANGYTGRQLLVRVTHVSRYPEWGLPKGMVVMSIKREREVVIHSDPPPTPMLLWCPECSSRHVDEGEFATKVHHTHACQTCGHVWRPALVATVGVKFLPGFKNKPASSTPLCSWVSIPGGHPCVMSHGHKGPHDPDYNRKV